MAGGVAGIRYVPSRSKYLYVAVLYNTYSYVEYVVSKPANRSKFNRGLFYSRIFFFQRDSGCLP